MGSKCCANHGVGDDSIESGSSCASYSSTAPSIQGFPAASVQQHQVQPAVTEHPGSFGSDVHEQQPSGAMTLLRSLTTSDHRTHGVTNGQAHGHHGGSPLQPSSPKSPNPLQLGHQQPSNSDKSREENVAELREMAKRSMLEAQQRVNQQLQQQRQVWHSQQQPSASAVRAAPRLGTMVPIRASVASDNSAPPTAAHENEADGDCEEEDTRSRDEFSLNSEASTCASLSAHLPTSHQSSNPPIGQTSFTSLTLPVLSDPLKLTKLDGKSRRASKVPREEILDEERRGSEVSFLERSFDGAVVLERTEGEGSPALPRSNSFDQYLVQHIKAQGEQSKVVWFRGAECTREGISRRDRQTSVQQRSQPGFTEEVVVAPAVQTQWPYTATEEDEEVPRDVEEETHAPDAARKEQLDQGGTHAPPRIWPSVANDLRETVSEPAPTLPPAERGRKLSHLGLATLIPSQTPHKLQLAKRSGPMVLDFCI